MAKQTFKARYERVIEIVEDTLALERHFASKKTRDDPEQFVRADGFKRIVEATLGFGALLHLDPVEEPVSGGFSSASNPKKKRSKSPRKSSPARSAQDSKKK
jgi:hypothetical protein